MTCAPRVGPGDEPERAVRLRANGLKRTWRPVVANPASKASQEPSGVPGSAAAPASAQHPADLAALTGRDDFLLELGEVLGGRASVHPADSIEAALEQLSHARHRRLLVIDSRDTGEVRNNVESAAEKIPGAVILVFAEAQVEKEIAAALKGTQVFAILPLPVEYTKTAAVLEAALGDIQQDNTKVHRTPAATELTADALHGMRSQQPLRPQVSVEPDARRPLLWWGVGAGVLAAAGATWFLIQRKPHVSAATSAGHGPATAITRHVSPVAQPVVDTSIVQGRVDELLDKARRAMFQRHFTTPKGANALVYYRSVLAADRTNGEALDGLRRVGNVLVSRFTDAIDHSQFPVAALALATLKVAQPSDPRIPAFQRQLYVGEISQAIADNHADQAAALLPQAAQAGVAPAALSGLQARVTQLQQSHQTQDLATAVANSIRADNLTGPGGAEAELARLRTIAPTATATQRATQALTKAMLAKAHQDGLAGNGVEENRWLAAAQSNGASASVIAGFQKQLAADEADAAQAKVNGLLARARSRIENGALTSPAGNSAAYYLLAVENTHPTGAMLAAEQHVRSELASKLLARAAREAHADNAAASQTDMTQARRWGATAAEIRAATAANQIALRQGDQPTGADLMRLAAELQRVRYTPPSYPDRALSERITGDVTVQYVVDKKGAPRDVRVIAARPPDVFDRAALDAIRSWRYKPVNFHGHPVDVPVRTLIRFVLPK